MEWFQYLLEANLYLILGFICFYLTLRKETFYNFNRWYLIVITVLSFLLPLCSISWAKITPGQSAVAFQSNFKTLTSLEHFETQQNLAAQFNTSLTWLSIIQFVYLLIVGALIFKIVYGIFKISKLYFQSPKIRENNITYIFLAEEKTIFSFLSWLFYHPSLKDSEAIMTHELVHIKERHSLDLLFFDLVIAINWFNPLVYLLFKAVKINHEFIADGKASQKMASKYEYAKLLINYVGKSAYRFGHPISSSSQLEQRICQLGYEQSAKHTILQSMVILPFLFAAVILFSVYTSSKSYKIFTYHAISLKSSEKLISKIDHPQKAQAEIPNKSIVLHIIPEKRTIKRNRYVITTGDVPKKRINALEVIYDWTRNAPGRKIRKIKHSIFIGKEAQLFRGDVADTLYVDYGNFKISGNEVEVMVDQLMIGSLPLNQKEKELVVIDAKKEKIITVLPQVSIKTKGMIHEVRLVGQDGEQAKRNLLAYNMRVQYASVNAAQIFVEKEDENAPYQPGILW